MRIRILTLFPDMVRQGLSFSVIGRAIQNGILDVEAIDIREFAADRRGRVDDYPYGGGAGMLMQAQPVYDAWESAASGCASPRTIYLTPQGAPFTQKMARELSAEEELILICGHYEGIDERALEEIAAEEVSIGDYVLTGGELAAMVLIDAVGRLVPGVLHNSGSAEAETFDGDLLEYPQYTRPAEWRGRRVPEVLFSGDQREVAAWRLERSRERTRERRPDIFSRRAALEECAARLRREKLLHADMTELIARGQAELIAAEAGGICLRDRETGICYHTASDEEAGVRILGHAMEALGDAGSLPEWVVFHQDFMASPAREEFGMEAGMECRQAVYTRREKVSQRGLYRTAGGAGVSWEHTGHPAGQNAPQNAGRDALHPSLESDRPGGGGGLPCIGPLRERDLPRAAEHYSMMGGYEENLKYLEGRLRAGWLFGAYLHGELAGIAGMHAEGSMGMLSVFPEFRGHRVGMALEAYVVNASVERGFMPYAQVDVKNGPSLRLQESLGLAIAKGHLYWMRPPQGR